MNTLNRDIWLEIDVQIRRLNVSFKPASQDTAAGIRRAGELAVAGLSHMLSQKTDDIISPSDEVNHSVPDEFRWGFSKIDLILRCTVIARAEILWMPGSPDIASRNVRVPAGRTSVIVNVWTEKDQDIKTLLELQHGEIAMISGALTPHKVFGGRLWPASWDLHAYRILRVKCKS